MAVFASLRNFIEADSVETEALLECTRSILIIAMCISLSSQMSRTAYQDVEFSTSVSVVGDWITLLCV